VVERSLSTGGTYVLAAVLAAAAVCFFVNPEPFQAMFSAVVAWGVPSRKLACLLCFLPVLAAGALAGFAFDLLTRQGVFAPEGMAEGGSE
jgi:hypothetical protein